MEKYINEVNVQKENYNIEDKFSCKKIKYKNQLLSSDTEQIIDLTNFVFGVQSVKVNGQTYYPNNLGEVDIGTIATLSDITLVNEKMDNINDQLLQKLSEEQLARIQSDKKINVSQSSTEGYITFTNSDGDSVDIWVGSSGSGGGTNYNNLANKPKINGVDLIGNRNGNDLQLANLSDLENKQDKLESGINIKTINGNTLLEFGNLELQNKLESGLNIKTINNQSILGSGNITIRGGGGGSGGTSNYDELSNKPKINGVELIGNKTSSQLNLATKTEVDEKQDKLISGSNIKTINNQSILGSGNIDIQGGGMTEAEKAEINGKIDALQGQVDTLSGTVGTQGSTIETVSSNVASAVDAIESLNGLVETLSGTVNGQQSSIDTLTGNLETVSTNVDSLQSDVSSLQTDTEQTKSDVSKLKTDVSSLQSSLESVQKDISALQGETYEYLTNEEIDTVFEE